MQHSPRWKTVVVGLIGFHLLVVVAHSVAHEALAVKATAWQLAFIVPVIIGAPPLAAALARSRPRAAAALAAASLAGSFVFGLYYHFVAHTIDHVDHVARLEPAFWTRTFIATAHLLAVSELAGALAALAWRRAAGRPA